MLHLLKEPFLFHAGYLIILKCPGDCGLKKNHGTKKFKNKNEYLLFITFKQISR